MTRNIFILALEEQQRLELETLRDTSELAFHGLLDVDLFPELGPNDPAGQYVVCRQESAAKGD